MLKVARSGSRPWRSSSVGCGSGRGAAIRGDGAHRHPDADRDGRAGRRGMRFEKGHSRAVRQVLRRRLNGAPIAGVEAEYHQPPKPVDRRHRRHDHADRLQHRRPAARQRPRASSTRPTPRGRRATGCGGSACPSRFTTRASRSTTSVLGNALLRYAPRRAARPALGVKAGCSHGFDDIVRIDVGLRARGCLLFQVPVSARPRQLQLALKHGAGRGGRALEASLMLRDPNLCAIQRPRAIVLRWVGCSTGSWVLRSLPPSCWRLPRSRPLPRTGSSAGWREPAAGNMNLFVAGHAGRDHPSGAALGDGEARQSGGHRIVRRRDVFANLPGHRPAGRQHVQCIPQGPLRRPLRRTRSGGHHRGRQRRAERDPAEDHDRPPGGGSRRRR